MDKKQLMAELCRIAQEAGAIIMEVYHSAEVAVEMKEDESPVTKADLLAHRYIMDELVKVAPDIFVVSEESEIHPEIERNERFFLVDPLDGTKSFIKKTGEFTVNIGLIEQRKPVLGVVYVPVTETLYFTGADGAAYRQVGGGDIEVISVAQPDETMGYRVVASQSHRTVETNEFIEGLSKVDSTVSAGSSLKFCLVAEGKADIYPRFGLTMEWDTAAAHAVLLAAGGKLTKVDGGAFLYGKVAQEKPFLNDYFIASSG